MLHVPELVIERIAAVADSPSLVLLASCNRHLWQCIRGLQHYWKQRYMQEHSLEDDDELSWLRWHIKTLRASANDTSSDDGDIDWFRAYCHRNACDANWFKNDTKRVKDVYEVTVRSRNCDIVLDRAYSRASSDHCHVLEYCQPKGGSQRDRYWRRYAALGSDSDGSTRFNQCSMASTYLVAVEETEGSETIYAWPASRAFNTKPRRFSYSKCKYRDARDRWLVYTTRETRRSNGDEQTTTTTVHVMDLATGRSSKCHTHLFVIRAFLQRVADDTATMVLASYDLDGKHISFYWSLWQFSIAQTDYDCRCLMQGKVNTLNMRTLATHRLDDNRFIMTTRYSGRPKPDARDDVADLAVISTQHSDGDKSIESQQPVWSRYVKLKHAKTMVPQDRIIVYSEEGWTVYRLSDGSILSFTSMDSIRPLLEEHCGSRVIDYLRDWDYYKDDYIVCPSEDFKSLIGVDVIYPERIKKLDIAYLMDLYGMDRKVPYITEEDYARYRIEPLDISVCSHHTLSIRVGDICKMLDLSIYP